MTTQTALTRVRSNGALADTVEAKGGSIKRVFARADLPLALIENPDLLVPLRDQIHLLEYASRELGDHALSARLAATAGVPGLGVYGERILSAPNLQASIDRANVLIGSMLQSATSLRLDVTGNTARWSYETSVSTEVGHQKHDTLALTYMLDLLRRFAGSKWTPPRLQLAGGTMDGRSDVQDVMSCDIDRGDISAIIFPSELLDIQNLRSQDNIFVTDTPLPDPSDTIKCVEHLIHLALLEGRPHMDWIANKMELSGRTLQRHLNVRGTTFDLILDRILTRHASRLLEQKIQIAEIAFQLGYTDPSHFVRAFRRWTGMTPSEFRSGMDMISAEKRSSYLSERDRFMNDEHSGHLREILTLRELQILELVARGASSKEVGRALSISPRTVDAHRARIMDKLHARNSADLMRIYITWQNSPG